MAAARVLTVAAVLLGGCPEAPAVLWVAIDAPPDVALRRDDLQLDAAVEIVDEVERFPRGWALAIAVREGQELPEHLRIDTGGRTCPAVVMLKDRDPSERIDVTLRRWFEVERVEAQVGWDAEVRIDATPGCLEALRGRLSWRHVSGPELLDREVRRQGFLLTGRTGPMPESLDGDRWGIVPVSARTRQTTVMEARYEGTDAEVEPVRVRIHRSARTTGIPSVPLGHRLVLSDDGWTVAQRPEEAQAAIETGARLPTLRPDRSGEWTLRDREERELLLRVGRFDETPLDCGRAECHAAETRAAAHSPMTTVLARGLAGELGDAWTVGCAIECHATGEPGLGDGGFAHLARDLGVEPQGRLFDALPRAMRRTGAVSCTACHGPGAIPAEEARWAILRSDVCAVCHDAPPRYGHHVAFGSSAMSRADADETARTDGRCVRCHTTHGFLADAGIREQPSAPPRQVGAIGLGCATCHAPHGEQVGIALLRDVPAPRALEGVDVPPRSRVCVRCHAPNDEPLPVATQAAVLWGRGAVTPSGEAIAASSPHASVQGGCVGCHRAGPDVERGAAHGFAVDETACESCHEHPATVDESLTERVDAAWTALVDAGVITPGPTHGQAELHAEPGSATARAARTVALLHADPAAAVHNPDLVERALTATRDTLPEPAAPPPRGR